MADTFCESPTPAGLENTFLDLGRIHNLKEACNITNYSIYMYLTNDSQQQGMITTCAHFVLLLTLGEETDSKKFTSLPLHHSFDNVYQIRLSTQSHIASIEKYPMA